jgi:PBP1b-binding outer membrane lipoprotein LpoB
MKIIISILVLALILVSAASCGAGNNAETDPQNTEAQITNADSQSSDMEKVALALVAGLPFDSDIKDIENSVVINPERIYEVFSVSAEDVTKACFYRDMSAGSAEEVAAFECANAQAVENVKTALNNRITYLHDQWQSYGPAQVPKIDGAAIVVEGNCVFFAISNDSSSAQQIIDNTVN